MVWASDEETVSVLMMDEAEEVVVAGELGMSSLSSLVTVSFTSAAVVVAAAVVVVNNNSSDSVV